MSARENGMGREGGGETEETHIHCGVDRPSHRARLPALCTWWAGARRAGMRQVRDEGVGEACGDGEQFFT